MRQAHSLIDELPAAREPLEPIITGWRDVWSIAWQTGLLLVLIIGIPFLLWLVDGTAAR